MRCNWRGPIRKTKNTFSGQGFTPWGVPDNFDYTVTTLARGRLTRESLESSRLVAQGSCRRTELRQFARDSSEAGMYWPNAFRCSFQRKPGSSDGSVALNPGTRFFRHCLPVSNEFDEKSSSARTGNSAEGPSHHGRTAFGRKSGNFRRKRRC